MTAERESNKQTKSGNWIQIAYSQIKSFSSGLVKPWIINRIAIVHEFRQKLKNVQRNVIIIIIIKRQIYPAVSEASRTGYKNVPSRWKDEARLVKTYSLL